MGVCGASAAALVQGRPGDRGEATGTGRRTVAWFRIGVAAVVVIALYLGLAQAIRVAPRRNPACRRCWNRTRPRWTRKRSSVRSTPKAAEEARRRAEELAKAREQAKAEILQTMDGHDITVVGDSVTVGSTPALQQALPGVVVDAKTSRFIQDVPQIVSQLKAQGQLRRFVVISANTNAAATQDSFEQIAAAAGEGHVLVIMTGIRRPQLDSRSQSGCGRLRACASGFGGHRRLVDGHRRAQTEMLTSDGIHPTTDGMALYADVVKNTIADWMAMEATAS